MEDYWINGYLRIFFWIITIPQGRCFDGGCFHSDTCSVLQTNRTFLVVVSDNSPVTMATAATSTTLPCPGGGVGMSDPQFAIKIFQQYRTQGVLQLTTHCEDGLLVESLLGDPTPPTHPQQLTQPPPTANSTPVPNTTGAHPTPVDAVGVQGEGDCSTLALRGVGLMLAEIIPHFGWTHIVLIYTDATLPLLGPVRTLLGQVAVSVSLWRLAENTMEADIGGIHSGIQAVVCLSANDTLTQRLIQRARQQYLTMRDYWSWLVVEAGPAGGGLGAGLLPGERVILLATETHHQSACSWRLVDHVTSAGLWVKSLANERLERVGTWTEVGGVSTVSSDIWETNDFHGKQFNITTVSWPVFHYKEEVGGRVVWKGIAIELLNAIADSLNFTYVFIPPPDGSWGSDIGNGTWNGMVGMVMRGKADFALGKFTMTGARKAVIDFTTAWWNDQLVLVQRKPPVLSMFLFAGPFSTEVWYGVLLSVPLCALALTLVQRAEDWLRAGREGGGGRGGEGNVGYPQRRSMSRRRRGGVLGRGRGGVGSSEGREGLETRDGINGGGWGVGEGRDGSRKRGLGQGRGRGRSMGSNQDGYHGGTSGGGREEYCSRVVHYRSMFTSMLWFAYGSLLNQGWTWMPRSSALRVMVGLWWAYVMVVTATFTGNLVAVLTVPRVLLPVNSLADLATSSKTPGVIRATSHYDLFKYSTSPLYQSIWKMGIRNDINLVGNYGEGLKRVMQQKDYIFIGEEGGVAPTVYKDCRYALGRQKFFPSTFGWVFPRYSPYLPAFNAKISSLVEQGLLHRWRRKYYPRDLCSQTSNSFAVATLEQTQGAFVLLGICVGGCFVIMVIECIVVRCRRTNRTNNSMS